MRALRARLHCVTRRSWRRVTSTTAEASTDSDRLSRRTAKNLAATLMRRYHSCAQPMPLVGWLASARLPSDRSRGRRLPQPVPAEGCTLGRRFGSPCVPCASSPHCRRVVLLERAVAPMPYGRRSDSVASGWRWECVSRHAVPSRRFRLTRLGHLPRGLVA